MDYFYVAISGEKLCIPKIVECFSELKVVYSHNIGDNYFTQNGVIKKTVGDKIFCYSCINFTSEDRSFNEFLIYINSVIRNNSNYLNFDIQVWCVYDKSEQINGELSKNEISLLNEMGASLCWSVY